MQKTISNILFFMFVLGFPIIALLNEPEVDELSPKYEAKLNDSSNIKSKLLKVVAYEDHPRFLMSQQLVYFEGLKDSYEVTFIHSNILSEGSVFELKYIEAESEVCVVSIRSRSNPKIEVLADLIPRSKHSKLCRLLN